MDNKKDNTELKAMCEKKIWGKKGRASFQLFKKGRASPKSGRAPRPAKQPRQNTGVYVCVCMHACVCACKCVCDCDYNSVLEAKTLGNL